LTVTYRRCYIRRPRAAGTSYTARQVAQAYNYPLTFTGKGGTCGIVELGGGYSQQWMDQQGWHVTAVPVAGGSNTQDGPNGADGEVQLDIEVVAGIAPAAQIRVYFAPNTDSGFLAGIRQAVAECDVVSISWGGAEPDWPAATMDAYDAAFAAARKAGVAVFAASGDTGSSDGTGRPAVDFPASSPNVLGCGGTRLTLDASGARAGEVVWDDNDTTSATGGGVSQHFPGRQVPDVAGNADPQTGYRVYVDGGQYVIGGTSAVAPLYAGLTLLLREALGGRPADLMDTLLVNPGVCFDVTSGDNGAYRAGPGRDNTTGLGVVDGARLLAVLKAGTPPPPPPPTATTRTFPAGDAMWMDAWAGKRHVGDNKTAAGIWKKSEA
jgi:kumamolisin